MKDHEQTVPVGLQRWFIVHFALDIVFAVPLMVAPSFFLTLLGWDVVDPVTSRIVAAALFGIGLESLLNRKGSRSSFRTMLNLKIIWSFAAVAGIGLSLIQDADQPPVLWGILGIFAGFNGLWIYWKIRMNRMNR